MHYKTRLNADELMAQSSEVLAELAKAFDSFNEEQKKAQIKKVCHHSVSVTLYLADILQANGIFELRIKSDAGKEEVWTIDLKKTGTVYKGPAKPKSDVAIILSDETFVQLADGKVRSEIALELSCYCG